ncbi:8683_t:CDS:2, partial [Dentiscutata erythropus]
MLLPTLSPYFTNWTSIILALLVIYVAHFYYKYFTRQNPLPGPIPIPILGTIHIHGKNPHSWYKKNAEKAGTIWEFYIGFQRYIIINHVKHIEKIYKPTLTFFKRPPIPSFEKLGLDKGIFFNNDHNSWHRNRKLIARALSTPKFFSGFVFSVQKLFKESEERWNLTIKDGIEFDISLWIKFFATDLAIIQITKLPSCSLVSFDSSNEIVRSEEEKKSLVIANSIHTFIESLTFFMLTPSFIMNYVPSFTSFRKKSERNIDFINNTIINIVNKRKQELKEGADLSSDLLDSLLMAHTLQNPEYNDDSDNMAPITAYEVNAILWDVLLAGIGSTNDAFCFVVYNIAKNPEILIKIRKEIDEVFGSDFNDYFTIEKLINCRYTEAVIKESMRYIAPAPFTVKVLSSEENIAGYNWPSGTSFWIDHQNISNNPDYWNDPKIFNPDRFLNEDNTSNDFTLFGGGVRICPGKHMAMNWLKILTVKFYSKYNVELVKDENIKYNYNGANVVYDLNVRISLRDIN